MHSRKGLVRFSRPIVELGRTINAHGPIQIRAIAPEAVERDSHVYPVRHSLAAVQLTAQTPPRASAQTDPPGHGALPKRDVSRGCISPVHRELEHRARLAGDAEETRVKVRLSPSSDNSDTLPRSHVEVR